MTNDTIIIVHYLPKTEDYHKKVEETKKELSKHWESGKAFMYFIPTDGEMHVECINPKLVDEKEYEKAKEILRKIEVFYENLPKVD